MKGKLLSMLKKFCAGMLGAVLISGSMAGAAFAADGGATQAAAAPAATTASTTQAATPTTEPLKLYLNLAARSLATIENGKKTNLFPIAPGKPGSPTPVGYFKVQEKEMNPTWTDPDSGASIPSGPDCPLGYRWIQIQGNYGIHGTNNPSSIGTYASHGCVRMYEKDVEKVYDMVQVGTPIEITYNRVVVEKAPDDTVTYYIYPDSYNWQKLTVSDVSKWLDGYGVGNFVSDQDIQAKIDASDGNPTYIAKVYPLYVNGTRVAHNAVVQNNVTYLPASDVAAAVGTKMTWDADTQTVTTGFGQATGFDKKGTIYSKGNDEGVLYKLTGGLTDGKYQLTTVKPAATTPAATTEAAATTTTAETTAKAAETKATTGAKTATTTATTPADVAKAQKDANAKAVAAQKAADKAVAAAKEAEAKAAEAKAAADKAAALQQANK